MEVEFDLKSLSLSKIVSFLFISCPVFFFCIFLIENLQQICWKDRSCCHAKRNAARNPTKSGLQMEIEILDRGCWAQSQGGVAGWSGRDSEANCISKSSLRKSGVCVWV